jgi:DNA-binding SARP family transcriptional activator/TolB-like protein
MPSRFLLQTLGGLKLSVRDTGESVLVNQRKRLAFIAALAADVNGGLARERQYALFWAESSGERARNALNQMVFAVRRDLGDEAIQTDGLSIRLNADIVASDVRAFREALSAGRFTDAVEMYRGPFLDGLYLRDAAEFERWAEDTRQALAGDYARALERDIDAALQAGPSGAAHAVRYGRLLARHDPLSTQAALRLVRAFELSGDASAALQHAATHASHVRAELAGEPGPELEREVARIRAGNSAGAPVSTASASESGANARVTTAVPDRIGRSERKTRRAMPWLALAACVVVLVALAAVAPTIARLGARTNDSLDSSRVLVAALANRTGDSTLDYVGYVASDWITQALAKSDLVRVVYGPTAFALSRSFSSDAREGDSDRAKLLSQRSMAGTVVSGSYYLARDSIVISASVTDGRTGRVLRTVPPITAAKSDPMRAVQELRERAVGALATLLDPRLASLSALSSSPPRAEAYRTYMEGLESYRRGRPQTVSLERFLLAAHEDSSFVLPLIWATMMASNTRNDRVRDSSFRVLEAHKAQLAPIDRYAVDYLSVIFDSSSRARAIIAAGSRIVELAPGSNWSMVQSDYLYSAGYAREALAVGANIDPERSWAGVSSAYWLNRVRVLHRLGEYDRELRLTERARMLAAGVGGRSPARLGEIGSLIALGHADSALSLVRADDPSLNDQDRIKALALAARELRAHSRREAADSLYRIVLGWFRARRDSSAMRPLRSAYIDYALQAGALEDARDAARAALADSSGPLVVQQARGALAIVAASRGDRTGALEQIRHWPDVSGNRVAVRWYDAEYKALVAGALHDRPLTLRYLGEMESQGQRADPDAADLSEIYPQLSWLAADRRMREPYVGQVP